MSDLKNTKQNKQSDEIVSLEELRKHFERFNLSDEKILQIKNYLIGISGKSIDTYLKSFR